MRRPLLATSLALLALLPLSSCDGGGRAPGWRETPEGTGPRVVWDLYAEDLANIPLPNDVATWPDPTSPTGLRLNASVVVPTNLERDTRSLFDSLDGWGTFAPISVAFDADLDLQDLLDRQGGMDHFSEADFPRHAVYLVDLETGLPVPLDLNSGNFPYVTTHPDQYFDHDPRATESNILFETVEEDTNGNGVLDPGEDTDFDGVLDHPNTLDGRLLGTPLETVDRMAWFYERETKTLIVRPLLPLRPKHRYAVVLTDRLVGVDGQPVRSPFDFVHHPRQAEDLRPLPARLAEHPELYGSLASEGWDGIAFAWSFTTQSVTDDLDTIREGLYGRGSMRYLADEISTDVVPIPMQGGRGCPDPGARVFIAPGDQVRPALRNIGQLAFDLDDDALDAFERSYESLDHIVSVMLETPYFFEDPDHEDLSDAFDVDYVTGRARHTRETITMTMYIPKETPERRQPFSPVVYVHGHGSNMAEVLAYGGLVLQHGYALVTINAQGHGIDLDRALRTVIRNTLGHDCVQGLADALMLGRARDLDENGSLDSGADFWTAYVFHTRDAVRQTVIDQVNAFRILRSFDGARRAGARTLRLPNGEPDAPELSFDGDFDRDGTPDLAGDFDADGVPDLGGPSVRYAMAGGSLGGIITALTAGVEPMVTTAVPVVGGGGLSDVATRTENGSVRSAMILRLMGPFVVSARSSGPGDDTSCAAGDYAIRVRGSQLSRDTRTEIACVSGELLGPDDVMFVRNLTKNEVRCAGATNHEAGRFRVGIGSDQGDRWSIEIYRDALSRVRFGDCTFEGAAPAPDRTIDTWEVDTATPDHSCPRCASWGVTKFELGSPLRSPTAGFGRQRQSPALRRLVMLAQIALERGDPVNYVGRVFLDPVTAPDIPVEPRSILVTHTTGDPNVCIATGFTMARAAGVLPFLPADAPDFLADFRAPPSFSSEHPGFASPNDVLLGYHVIEGLARLERHPVPGAPTFLADVDNLSDGLSFFDPNGRDTLPEADGGLAPVRPDRPLRWSRRSRRMSSPGDVEVFRYAAGEPTSGVVSPYVEPRGIHGFEAIYDPNSPFDMAVYMFNMVGRYVSTDARDIPYLSDPTGHHCLEDSSCSYLRH